MKYEKCLTCKQMSATCDGPNLLSMEAVELGLWCNELRKITPGMTYDKVVAGTNVSKTAVHGFLNGTHEDCSYHTAHEVAKFIAGGKWDDNPCGNITSSEKAQYEERIRQLEEGVKWRDDKIEHLTNNNQSMQTLITNTNKRNTETQEFLRKQINNKNKVIALLATLLSICLIVIIGALVVDKLNPDIGFFWLRSFFNQGIITPGHITS